MDAVIFNKLRITKYQLNLNLPPLNKMATRAKNRKTFKQHFLLGQWLDFKIISLKCSLGGPLPKLLKLFRFAEQNVGSLSLMTSNDLKPSLN